MIGGLSDTVRRIGCGNVIDFGFSDTPLMHASIAEQKKEAKIDGQSMAEKIISELMGD